MPENTRISATNGCTIYGVEKLFSDSEIKVSDIALVKYTVYETEHPDSNTQTPVEYYADVEVPAVSCFMEETQTTTVYEDVGGVGVFGRKIEFNFRLVIPVKKASTPEGVQMVYPFPQRGMYYRVVITIEFENPDVADYTKEEVIFAI
ncbi:MAG: hypothetical protein LBT05_08440 [Planctomycetaceae bacterium]|jgi:hypothetical protein|nr:hypothetical protein [Planctomycetaceae bacterium]